MPSKKKERKFETSILEGEVIGHFVEFKSQLQREYINKDTGEVDGMVTLQPKIRPGVIVQVGEQRLSINVVEDDEKLPYGTTREKVTKTARKAAETKVKKKLPNYSTVKVRVKTALDNGWKRYSVVAPKED